MVDVTFGLEAPAARAIERVGLKLFNTTKIRRANKRVREEARTLVPGRVAQRFLIELDAPEVLGLEQYLTSPDFEEIALQFVLGHLLGDVQREELRVNIRKELRHGLRSSAHIRSERLLTAADVVFDALTTAYNEILGPLARGDLRNPELAAVAAHLTAAAAANSQLLRNLADLADIHDFARHLRAQVAAVHSQMRLPHLGVSRAVPYDQLYVEPHLRPSDDASVPTPRLPELALPGRRSVILGDPGAGKSTLAAKLANDVASDLIPGAESRVPFLLVLRNFAGSFRTGGQTLAQYLEQVAADPYNLTPPPQAVDYLLHNGRAVVILDGLDELVEPDLRRNVVNLLEAFVNLYPLVPVLVTARRIGYTDAPLDRRLFATGIITELNEDQVGAYAHHWFALDDSTPEPDRTRIAKAFLTESASIDELRSNPLLLALLCAMYSSEHYIPQNLPQVYEQCAIMLFNRWDKMRGIPVPLEFRGRLRGAIQYLAWHLFTAEESSKALPRHRIVRTLADYLVAKHFDEDDALATADQFVDFCTDRSWILTDIGESRYGFTHRTFLEYFAAEHLVRTHPTAAQLWRQLRPRLLEGQWDVVAQIALQLLDRNIDGGAEALLHLAVSELPQDLLARVRLHDFAARALSYLHPGHDVIIEIVAAALADVLGGDIRDRFYYWITRRGSENWRLRVHPLDTVMTYCSPGNSSAVRRILTKLLSDQIESGHELAMLAGYRPARLVDTATRIWRDVTEELQHRHAALFASWSEDAPYATIVSGEVRHIAARFGPRCLYLGYSIMHHQNSPIVERFLRWSTDTESTYTSLCATLIAAKRPWITDPRWWVEFDQADLRRAHTGTSFPIDQPPLTARSLLWLPYLETSAYRRFDLNWLDSSPLMAQLIDARIRGDWTPELLRSLRDDDLTEDVREFLLSWVRREFDLLPPRP